jgi:hypothetical protein
MKKILTFVFLWSQLSGVAVASENFTLQLPVLSYQMTATSKSNTDQSDTSSKSTGLTSFGLAAASLKFTFNALSFDMYPLADQKKVAIGYGFGEIFEAGAELGADSQDLDDPRSSRQSQLVGAFAGAKPRICETMNVETYARVESIKETGSSTNAAGKDENINVQETQWSLSLSLVTQLNDQTAYLGGISYGRSKRNDKENGVVATSGALAINLVSLRYTFD